MNRKFLYLACLTMLSAQGADTTPKSSPRVEYNSGEELRLGQLQNPPYSQSDTESSVGTEQLVDTDSDSSDDIQSFIEPYREFGYPADSSDEKDNKNHSNETLCVIHTFKAQEAIGALMYAMERGHPNRANKYHQNAIRHMNLIPQGTKHYDWAQSLIGDLSNAGAESEPTTAEEQSGPTRTSVTGNHTALRTITKTGGVTALLLASGVCVKEALQEHSALYAGGATISALGAYFLYQSNFSMDPDKNSATENLALCTAIDAGLGVGLGAPLGIAARYYKN